MNLNFTNPGNIQFLQQSGLPLLFKLGFLTMVLFVVIFLLVVLRQIYAMNRILTQDELLPYLVFFNMVLIAAIIVLFIVGVVIL